MLLAELTLDLSNLSTVLRWAIGILLLFVCGVVALYPILVELFKDLFAPSKKRVIPNTEFSRKDSGRSSDTPPPVGFAEHLEIIEKTAPNADTAVWWEYAKAEMTEAEVAIAEAKLARKTDTK